MEQLPQNKGNNVTDPYSGREQTEAKHFILRRYLQELAFKVLTFQDITYVDGFSGPWETNRELQRLVVYDRHICSARCSAAAF